MAQVLPAFEAWMDAQGIERSPAIQLVAAAAGCSGLALGVQVRRCLRPSALQLIMCCCPTHSMALTARTSEARTF